jgi:hypothetical protein
LEQRTEDLLPTEEREEVMPETQAGPAGTAIIINMTAEALRIEMEASGQKQVQIAEAFQVNSQEEYDEAANRLVEIANYKARVVALYKESKDLAHRTHAKICDQERLLLKPAQQAETIYKDKALAYHQLMAKRQQEIDREQERQRKLAEEERINQARADMIEARKTAFTNLVAERLRLADEAADAHASPEAIIDILRAPLNTLPPIPTGMTHEQTKNLQQFSDELKLKLAEKAEQHKATSIEVEEMITEPVKEATQKAVPVYIPPAQNLPSVAPPTKKVFERSAALSPKTKYKADVFDIRLLCRAIADGRVSPMYVEPAQAKLNSVANAERDTLNIPGVRAIPDTNLSVNKSRGAKQ